jgi:hypothetical protein
MTTQSSLTVGENVEVNGNSDVVGNTTLTGLLSATEIVASNNITTQGSLTVDENVKVKGNLDVVGDTTMSGLLTAQENVRIAGLENSTSKDKGALVIENGGLGVEGNITVGEDLTIDSNLLVKGKSEFVDNIITQGTLTIKNNSNVAEKALKVYGGAEIGEDLTVKQNVFIESDENPSADNFTEKAALKVSGGATILGNLNVAGTINGNSGAGIRSNGPMSVDVYSYFTDPNLIGKLGGKGYGSSTNIDSYAFKIEGIDQGIAIKLSNPIIDQQASNKRGRATTEPAHNIISEENKFITFFDPDGKSLGAITGQTLDQLKAGHDYKDTERARVQGYSVLAFRTAFAVEALIKTGIETAIAIIQSAIGVAESGATVSLSFIPGVGYSGFGAPVVTASEAVMAAVSAGFKSTSIPMQVVNIGFKVQSAMKDIATHMLFAGIDISGIELNTRLLKDLRNDVGVSYSSGSGDYAEYLELLDYDDSTNITWGQVVGVKGGKISFNTDKVDKVMVVSMSPIVIGKQPKENSDLYKYKPVAFMGQVPVRLINKYDIGDYILPSGNHDGYAIAKKHSEMEIKDYSNIIGTCWSYTHDPYIANVAVGINSNDVVGVIENHKTKIDKLSERLMILENLVLKGSPVSKNNTKTSIDSNKKYKIEDPAIRKKIMKTQMAKLENTITDVLMRNKDVMLAMKSLNNKFKSKSKNKELYIREDIDRIFKDIFTQAGKNKKLLDNNIKIHAAIASKILKDLAIKDTITD